MRFKTAIPIEFLCRHTCSQSEIMVFTNIWAYGCVALDSGANGRRCRETEFYSMIEETALKEIILIGALPQLLLISAQHDTRKPWFWF